MTDSAPETSIGAVGAAAVAPAIWIEVEDLIAHSYRSDQPTGIQRVLFELIAAANALNLPGLRLCRLNSRSGQIEALDGTLLDGIIERVRKQARLYTRYGKIHRRLGIMARDVLRATPNGQRDYTGRPELARLFEREVRPGDVILSMGASWNNPRYAKEIAAQKARFGFRFVQLIHDIIPIDHAAITNPSFLDPFRDWLHGTARLAEFYLVPSRHVARSLANYAAGQGWAERLIAPIRFGSGFSATQSRGSGQSAPLIPERYALCVATVDPRKNLSLLVDVWERMVREFGPERVPLLLLAGHRGYQSAEFFRRLRETGHVGGRVRFMERVTNEALESLYRHAYFTVFPSRAEGWGLPVEESLIHGRPIFCSNATSLPEVGGDLALYFDPDDVEEAYGRISRAVREPGHVDELAERIRRDYRPHSWIAAMEEIVRVIQGECAARAGGRNEAEAVASAR